MKATRKTSAWLALVVASTLMLGACGSRVTAPAAVGGNSPAPLKSVTLNLGTEPPSLDPGKATDSASFVVLVNTQEGLVRLGEGGTAEKGSGLARDWEISKDGLTYTFFLKEGLKWSDGQPLTAKDIAYSWTRVLDPKTGSDYAYQLHYIKGAQAFNELDVKQADFAQKYEQAKQQLGIQVVNEKTLKILLETPTPYFLGLTAFPTYLPVREDLAQKHGESYAADADKMIFSGPFVVKSWNHESEIVLEKNPYYWDSGSVKLDQVTYVMVKDHNTSLNMFDAGELDMVGVPGDFIQDYKHKGLKSMSDAATFYVTLNIEKVQAFKNIKVRQAFSEAIDRKAFVENVAKNGSLPALGYVPPAITGPVAGQSFRTLSGNFLPAAANADKAKDLLSEGMKELKLDKLPKLTMLVTDDSRAKRYAQGLQEMWNRQLGVQVELEVVSFKMRLERSRKGDFQMAMGGWIGDYDDPMTFMDMWVTGGGFNDSRWSNPNYDSLINKIKKNANQQERMQDLAQAERMLLQELPIIPLYHSTSNWVQKPGFTGVLMFPVGGSTDLKWATIQRS